MKAEALKERPDYELFKQNDIVNFYNFQLPRWLVEDSRYIRLSIEAKFTYTLLFNRFQLSKHNGWINENGEVFVIYTRKELSERLNVSEKRISAAMNELKEYELIWERRCGRGFANQIYLANVKISIDDAVKSKGGPLDAPDESMGIEADGDIEERNGDLRTDKTAGLNKVEPEKENALTSGYVDNHVDNRRENGVFLPIASGTATLETPIGHFKNRQNVGSKTADSDLQEPPKRPPSYLDFSFKDFSLYNQSQSESSPYLAHTRTDGQTDADALKTLIEQAELESLDDGDATVIRDAIERLYFMQSIKIGGAVYPSESIRSNLWRLDAFVAQDAVSKITKNTTVKIRNSSAYVVTVLFNTIMETGSDLIVDPYLNFLRSRPEREKSRIGGG